jgi:hypothetical protein
MRNIARVYRKGPTLIRRARGIRKNRGGVGSYLGIFTTVRELSMRKPRVPALIMRKHQAQGADVVRDRLAVQRVGDECVRILDTAIKFAKGIEDAIPVIRSGHDIGGKRRTAQVLPLGDRMTRQPNATKQVAKARKA